MRSAALLLVACLVVAGCGTSGGTEIRTIAAHRTAESQYLSEVRSAAPSLHAITDAEFLAWARLSCKKQDGPVILPAPPAGSALERELPRLPELVVLEGLAPPLIQFCGGVFYDDFVRQVRAKLPALGFLTDSDLDVYETQVCFALFQHGPHLSSTNRPVAGKRVLTATETTSLLDIGRRGCPGSRSPRL